MPMTSTMNGLATGQRGAKAVVLDTAWHTPTPDLRNLFMSPKEQVTKLRRLPL